MGGDGGKSDMDRVGLFSEVGYATIGDAYPKIDPTSQPFNASAYKKRQMLPGGNKSKSALQAQSGYFENKFNRVIGGEAEKNNVYSDPIKQRRAERIKSSKKNVGKAFLPSNYPKKPVGLGNYYGTFGGKIDHFSPKQNEKAAYKKESRNFLTNPGKKGTGFGYVGVTLGKYQSHPEKEEYDRAKELRKKEISIHKSQTKGEPFKIKTHPGEVFDPNVYKGERLISKPSSKSKSAPVKPFRYTSPAKHPGGNKSGTFNPYPETDKGPFTVKKEKKVTTNSSGKLYQAIPGSRSKPSPSVMAANVNLVMNRNNYRTVRSVLSY